MTATIMASTAVRENGGRTSLRSRYDSWLGHIDSVAVGSLGPHLQVGDDILLDTNVLLRVDRREVGSHLRLVE